MPNFHEERCRRDTQSFSSSLLDAIYRSIDESAFHETKMKNQRNYILEDGETIRRAIMDNENRTRLPRKSRPHISTSSSSDSSEVDESKLRNFIMAQEKEKNHSKLRSKTKSKAMKIYGDLKKLKQPVSPGRRLTNFLNSLFSSKNNPRCEEISSKSLQKSMSVKEQTSRSDSKRSVRFHPMTCVYENDRTQSETLKGRKLLENNFFINEIKNKVVLEDEDGEDEDDMSCSSSDLFELENIDMTAADIATYKEELPVYGTTNFRTSRAIVNRSI